MNYLYKKNRILELKNLKNKQCARDIRPKVIITQTLASRMYLRIIIESIKVT